MKIELIVIKTNTSENRITLTLESTDKYENHIKVNDDYFVDIDELISALKALRKPILASSEEEI